WTPSGRRWTTPARWSGTRARWGMRCSRHAGWSRGVTGQVPVRPWAATRWAATRWRATTRWAVTRSPPGEHRVEPHRRGGAAFRARAGAALADARHRVGGPGRHHPGHGRHDDRPRVRRVRAGAVAVLRLHPRPGGHRAGVRAARGRVRPEATDAARGGALPRRVGALRGRAVDD